MDALFTQLNAIYPMSDGLQEYLAKNLKSRELKKREFLLKKGHINSVGSFVNSGLLHCYRIENDKKITTWFLQEKALAISVQSFFSQQPSKEYLEALEPSELFYLTYGEMQTAYKTFLEFNYIIRESVQKYYMLKDEHAYQLQRNGIAKDRYEWFLQNFPHLGTRVPLAYIASFLGDTRETLSRVRKKKS